MDMRFHWLRDRECQRQFRIYWRPGELNYADYWTKPHPVKHHQNIRKEFITPQIVLATSLCYCALVTYLGISASSNTIGELTYPLVI